MDAGIQRVTAAFPEPLPGGVQWPRTGIDLTDPALHPEQSGQVVAHAGVQDEFIAAYWLCAWMDVYLRSLDTQDPQKRDEAVSNIGKYTSLPAVKKYLLNPEHFEADIVAPARRGDSTTIREYYKGCRPYKDNQAAGSTS